MKIIHLNSEQRYWWGKVEPLMAKNGLHWEVQVDYNTGTVMLHVIHPNQIQVKDAMLTKIDVDRSHRSEEKIMQEIEAAVRKHTGQG